jgi:hypothetical protein
MRLLRWLVVLAPLAAAGCVDVNTPPPNHTTVVAPPGSTVICTNGAQPPC